MQQRTADSTATSAEKLAPTQDVGDDLDPQVSEGIHKLFEDLVKKRHPPGDTNVKRAVFLKPHGCAKATFEIAADVPESHRKGLFATPATRDAWVRISSDTVPSTSDFNNSTIGFSVKVLGVEGAKILAGEEHFKTHDFLTQNHHVFFVDTAKDFLEFTESIFDGTLPQYFEENPKTDQILKDMEKKVTNVLGSTYWSTTPYRFGDADYAKYKVVPCAEIPAEADPTPSDKNYLRARLERDVAASGACFEMLVQLRQGDEMPLDRATVEWSEAQSTPQKVATIRIAPQDIKPLDADCEKMSFTAWHALPEHRPVGTVNKARALVYKKLADLRRDRNGVPIAEPE